MGSIGGGSERAERAAVSATPGGAASGEVANSGSSIATGLGYKHLIAASPSPELRAQRPHPRLSSCLSGRETQVTRNLQNKTLGAVCVGGLASVLALQVNRNLSSGAPHSPLVGIPLTSCSRVCPLSLLSSKDLLYL